MTEALQFYSASVVVPSAAGVSANAAMPVQRHTGNRKFRFANVGPGAVALALGDNLTAAGLIADVLVPPNESFLLITTQTHFAVVAVTLTALCSMTAIEAE